MGKTGVGEWLSRHSKITYYFGLFLAVLVIYVGANAAMIAVGRDCLWHVDGQPLYMSFLAWEGQQLREAWNTFISGGGITVPFYTFSLGYGADAPLTMGGFLNDPLNLLAGFFAPENTIVCYTIQIIIRMMLAGITFSSYCFSRGHSKPATFVATVAYLCCGFVMFWGVIRHPKFINWAIFLPLILQGADRIFKGKSPALFIVGMGLQFFVSIYYGYMSCLTLLLYCLIKYFFAPRKRSVGDFVLLVLWFAIALVIAFCISGLLSLPQVISLLSQDRAMSVAYVPTLYSLNYYYRIGAELVGGDIYTRGIIFGAYVTIALLAFLLCGKAFDREARKPWFIALVLCLVGVLIPYVSHVFNGLGYPTDRWMLVIGFVSSYIICLTVPSLSKLERPDWKRVGIACVVIAVFAIAFAIAQIWSSKGARGVIWPLAMTIVFIIGFFIVRAVSQKKPTEMVACMTGAVLIVGGLTLTCGFYNSPLGDLYGANFPEYGVAGREITVDSPAAPIDAIEDDTVFRHTYPKVYGGMKNASLAHGTMGIDFYSSLYNQVVDNFRQDLGISDHYLNYSFVGSDSRLAIEKLTGAKYYVTKKGDKWQIPYTFSTQRTKWGPYRVYEAANPVALAFSADKLISLDRYKNLSMVEKAEALLQGVTLKDDAYAQDFEQANLVLTSKRIECKAKGSKDLKVDDGVIHVLKKDAKMTLKFAGLNDSETYLCFTNLGFKALTPIEQAEALGGSPSIKTYAQQALWTDPTRYLLTVKANGHSKSIRPGTPKGVGYGGKVDWAINMGYAKDAMTTMTVKFDKPGDYTFDSMEVVCQPVKPIEQEADALASRNLSDIELHTNGMSASIDIADEKPQLAVFTVAYSPGWSATVDGQPAEIVNADTAFMAIKVAGKGQHAIALSYITPGLEKGVYLTIAGFVVLIAIIVVFRIRSKRSDVNPNARHARR